MRDSTSTAPISHCMTTTMKKASPVMASRTSSMTSAARTGSHVKTSMPSKAQPALTRIVVSVLLTMATSASARTKADAVYQARLAVTDASRFRASTKPRHSASYASISAEELSEATLTQKASIQAFTLLPTIQRPSCPMTGYSVYHLTTSLSKSREGNLAPLSWSQVRKLLIQHLGSWTWSCAGMPLHMACTARCAQGLSGSKLGSKLQVSSRGPTRGVWSGARRPKSTVTSKRLRFGTRAGCRGSPAVASANRRWPPPCKSRLRQPGSLQLRAPKKQSARTSHSAAAAAPVVFPPRA
mmetsp:Transcript_81821/g.265189  ORF Transcript_81821/g.265189 Transcript_81821/m.265189 type:complete len:298 (+) Transcript_81821:682-1575(+)